MPDCNIYRLNVDKLSRMHVISVLSVLLIITSVLADNNQVKKPEETRTLKDAKNRELEVIPSTADASEDSEISRAKKSTTTTFCVEIRPSGPHQKPFQVCEPSESAQVLQPTSTQTHSNSYYTVPVFGNQDQPKTEPYKPPGQPKPNAIYSAPVKTYSPHTVPPPKEYAVHGAQYNSYRSNSEDSDVEEHRRHLMRMQHALAENEVGSTAVSLDHLRSAGYGGSSYIPVVPSQSYEKHRSHNGVVITCQPNLAGYAHNVPSSVHHPPAMHTYSYRSSAPRDYGGDRSGRYQVQSQFYGAYQQPHPYKVIENAYKPSSAAHQLTGQSATSSVYSTQASASVYNSPHIQTPTSYTPLSDGVEPHSSVPTPLPQTRYAPQIQPAQPYAHFSQNYGHDPSTLHHGYSPVPTSYGSSPVPYASATSGYAALSPAPQSFSQSRSFAPPPPASSSASQAYVSSGSYREAEEEHKLQTMAQQHKEKHTLQKMEEMSHQRAAGSQWGAEMSQEKASKIDDRVESSKKSWSAKKRSSEKVDGVKKGVEKVEAKHEAKNEVNRVDNQM